MKISVIMPVYNSGSYLEKAVTSILLQSHSDIELILVDDGSTDGSSARCDEFARRDPRVVVIHQQNSGICKARNAALKIAKGEYVAFSDHDDEYLPGLLEDSLNKAIVDNADIVKFKKLEKIIKYDKVIKERYSLAENVTYSKTQIPDNLFLLLNSFLLECVWDCIIKRDLFVVNNIYFDTSFRNGGEDIDIMFRLISAANRISVINKIYYIHYLRLGFSTSGKFNDCIFNTIWILPHRLNDCVKQLGIDITNHKEDYTLYIMHSFITSLVKHLSHKNCNYSNRKKISMLDNACHASFLPSWFWSLNTMALIKRSKRLGISYFLCKYKCYSFLVIGNNIRVRLL